MTIARLTVKIRTIMVILVIIINSSCLTLPFKQFVGLLQGFYREDPGNTGLHWEYAKLRKEGLR